MIISYLERDLKNPFKMPREENQSLSLLKLTAFSIFYGLVMINYIDLFPGGHEWYHVWLILMYFMPFVVIGLLYPAEWRIAVSMGMLSSLMNDIFYGFWSHFISGMDLLAYYTKWLLPLNVSLGWHLQLGLVTIPVYSWMMAGSIYARIIIVYLLIEKWRQETLKKNT